MADDFQTGICGGSWWNSARSTSGFEASGIPAAASSMSCSPAISVDEPMGSASGSTITFQDSHKPHVPDLMVGGSLMDSTMQQPTFGLSPSTMDWTQALLRSSGRAETSFHAMLQDDLSSRPYFRQEPSIDSDHAHGGPATVDSSMNLFKDMNQPFSLDQHQQLSFGNDHGGDSSMINNNFSYGCSTSVLQLQALLEPDTKPQQSIYDNRSANYLQSQMIGYRGSSSELQQTPWPKFPQFLKASPPKQQQPSNQLQFSNNTPFWNASAAAMSDFRSGFQPSMVQFPAQTSEQKPSCSNLTIKSNSECARDSSSSTTRKSSSGEQAFKKPRIETPSPLPTFKVRKEKLGDRITALQQLVSPFGKTDTASVLHEAIEYIKFLHEQVSVLSTPYMKHGHPMQHQQLNLEKSSKDGEGPKQDLRSRGLCLVPIASTYPVATENPAEFWTPTFGGTYR